MPCFVEPVLYVAFDVLYLAGQSLMARPLSERRAALAEVLPEHEYLSQCQGVVGKGVKFFAKMLAAGHEDLVAKRLASGYSPNGRGWKKFKERLELPCVVIGYKVVRQELRSLLMAALVDGKLAHIGAVELGVEGVRLADLDRLGPPSTGGAVRHQGPLARAAAAVRGAVRRLAAKRRVAGSRGGLVGTCARGRR